MNKSAISNQHSTLAGSSTIVVARLTVTRADGKTTIVEIQADATFHSFYRFYQQQGRRRSTKTLFRTANRNAYLPTVNAHLHQPGLHVIERQLRVLFAKSNPVVDTKLRIFKKRAYKKLINSAPTGLAKVHTVDLAHKDRPLAIRWPRKAMPVNKWLATLAERS